MRRRRQSTKKMEGKEIRFLRTTLVLEPCLVPRAAPWKICLLRCCSSSNGRTILVEPACLPACLSRPTHAYEHLLRPAAASGNFSRPPFRRSGGGAQRRRVFCTHSWAATRPSSAARQPTLLSSVRPRQTSRFTASSNQSQGMGMVFLSTRAVAVALHQDMKALASCSRLRRDPCASKIFFSKPFPLSTPSHR